MSELESVNFGFRMGERLLWKGQPRPGLLARGGDYLLMPFAVLWGGFALCWEYGVITNQHDLFLAAYGIPFVMLGLYLLAGRLFYDVFSRSRTYYALTDQRALARHDCFPCWVKSEELAKLRGVGIERHIRGDATLAFGPPAPFGDDGDYREKQLRFERLLNVEQVHKLVEQARKDARDPEKMSQWASQPQPATQ